MKRSILKNTSPLLLVAVCLVFMSYQNFPTDNDKQQAQAVIAEMNRWRSIGLSLSRQFIVKQGGTLELMDTPIPSYVSSFRIGL